MAAERISKRILELRLAPQVAVLGWEQHREATCLPAGHNGYFMDWIGVGEHARDQCMTHFMIGRDGFLPLADNATLARGSGYDAINGFFKLAHADSAFIASRRQDSSFVQQISEVSAGEAGSLLGKRVQRDVRFQWLAFHMHLEDRNASANIGPIKHVGAVRRCDHDHIGVRVKAIHLDKDLVQRLLAFVVGAAQPGSTLTANRINLIDEDDAGAIAFSLLEEVAHAARANADEHLHKFRAANAEEWHPCFPCDCARDQRLSCSRRANEQQALRNASAESGELFGIFEEFDNLL